MRGRYLAIISDELWEGCAAIRQRNGVHVGPHGVRVQRYALTGLGRCHRCGSTMHGSRRTKSSGRSWSYYVCRRRYGSKSCDQPLAPVDEIEGEIRGWLAAIRLPEGFQAAFAKATGDTPVRAGRPATQRRKSADERRARLRELFEMGDLERATYTARRDKVAADIRELDATPVAEQLTVADAKIETLVDDWDAMTGGQRRQVLETMFSNVEIEDGHLISATPRPGWLSYLETVCATRGWWAPDQRVVKT